MSLKRVKSANKQFKYSVFGYLREHEQNDPINIPMMIKYICLNYYLLTEKFGKHGDRMILNESNDTIKMGSDIKQRDCNTVYGDFPINANDESIGKFKWEFEVKTSSTDWFAIGIDSQNNKYINSDFTNLSRMDDPSQFYSWLINPSHQTVYLFQCSENTPSSEGTTRLNLVTGNKFKEINDQIFVMNMTLNVKDNVLEFSFDGQEIKSHTKVKLMNEQYHMAIAMHSDQQGIRLVSFSIQQQ